MGRVARFGACGLPASKWGLTWHALVRLLLEGLNQLSPPKTLQFVVARPPPTFVQKLTPLPLSQTLFFMFFTSESVSEAMGDNINWQLWSTFAKKWNKNDLNGPETSTFQIYIQSSWVLSCGLGLTEGNIFSKRANFSRSQIFATETFESLCMPCNDLVNVEFCKLSAVYFLKPTSTKSTSFYEYLCWFSYWNQLDKIEKSTHIHHLAGSLYHTVYVSTCVC